MLVSRACRSAPSACGGPSHVFRQLADYQAGIGSGEAARRPRLRWRCPRMRCQWPCRPPPGSVRRPPRWRGLRPQAEVILALHVRLLITGPVSSFEIRDAGRVGRLVNREVTWPVADGHRRDAVPAPADDGGVAGGAVDDRQDAVAATAETMASTRESAIGCSGAPRRPRGPGDAEPRRSPDPALTGMGSPWGSPAYPQAVSLACLGRGTRRFNAGGCLPARGRGSPSGVRDSAAAAAARLADSAASVRLIRSAAPGGNPGSCWLARMPVTSGSHACELRERLLLSGGWSD
jgi:hypothetical protein